MGDRTGIQWTDATWNPVRGCSRVSPGCEHCYAETMAGRFCGPGQPYEGLVKLNGGRGAGKRSKWTGVVRMVPEHLADPLRWRRPRRIFVNSMSDLFHEQLSDEDIAAVFAVMAAAPRHTFQVLTKRPERMRDWFRWLEGAAERSRSIFPADDTTWRRNHVMWAAARRADVDLAASRHDHQWPLPNVWLGVSVEDQRRADERIPLLLDTPAAVRFISAEPLLGPIDFRRVPGFNRVGLNLQDWWVIAGAESGRGARKMDLDWVRSIRDQCAAARVPFFYKQDIYEGKKRGLPFLDGRQHVEWPR
jgi:protein gp37